MSLSITQWCDGKFRPREIWEPELLEILWQECSRRNISALEFLEVIPGLGWPERDLAAAVEVWSAECDRLGYPDEEIEEVQS
jgi:hypothetical protein